MNNETGKIIQYDVEIHDKNDKFRNIEYVLYDSYSYENLIKFVEDSVRDVTEKKIFLQENFDGWLILDKRPYDEYPSFFDVKNGIPYRVNFDKPSNREFSKKMKSFKNKIIVCVLNVFYLEK